VPEEDVIVDTRLFVFGTVGYPKEIALDNPIESPRECAGE
jgi:hypothetical protein